MISNEKPSMSCTVEHVNLIFMQFLLIFYLFSVLKLKIQAINEHLNLDLACNDIVYTGQKKWINLSDYTCICKKKSDHESMQFGSSKIY